MKHSRLAGLATFLLCAVMATHAFAQSSPTGPDVIVGDLPNVSNYNDIGGIDAISVGTTSCNQGTANLLWIANTNEHPVIGQHLYRLHNGRMEQIGQSWLKHGFTALTQNLCDTCSGVGGSVLGIGCSDPYSSGLNGSQGGLGPKFEVNASTGVFPYPYSNPAGATGNSIFKRLQFHTSDIVTGAQYFVEGHYVTQDDAAAGNKNNNVSYREISFTSSGSGYNASLQGTTIREVPAVMAWATADPNVQVDVMDVPSDGRIITLYKTNALAGGLIENELAVYNMNSHRSINSVSVSMSQAATVTNIGFHDVDYHSGETPLGTDWVGTHANGAITWAVDNFATNPNANAIRWGTTYNFRWTSDMNAGNLTLGFFRPGTPSTLTVTLTGTLFTLNFPNGAPTVVDPDTPTEVLVDAFPVAGMPNGSTGMLHTSLDGAPFAMTPLTFVSGTTYRATLPPVGCYSTLDWYVTMDAVGGGTESLPANAPTTVITSKPQLVELVADNFQVPGSWSVTNGPGLTDGGWDHGFPIGGGDRGDPVQDSDGSGNCWLTDNVDGNSDVDGGPTILTSPSFDLRAYDNPQITFDYWYDNDNGVQDDTMVIEISDDNGMSWVNLETQTLSTGVWNERAYFVSDHVSITTGSMRIRLVVEDTGAASVVEAGFDNFKIVECPLMSEALAAGNVNSNSGPVVDVLTILGSNGGPLRRVVVGYGDPLTFELVTPPANTQASDFVIAGTLGIPDANAAYDLGNGIGELVLFPCPADPTAPGLFILADNLLPAGSCVPILPATLTPWFFIEPAGIPGPFQFTIQGLIRDASAPTTFSRTNAVIFKTSPDF